MKEIIVGKDDLSGLDMFLETGVTIDMSALLLQEVNVVFEENVAEVAGVLHVFKEIDSDASHVELDFHCEFESKGQEVEGVGESHQAYDLHALHEYINGELEHYLVHH
eukprot:CAMPEP_0116892474 /NCGR_PEP_ID=MMETSP0467-20121206/2685_1 /TAXON_ID=283647 /ORGANISM="Mesodinium pulex, Strain SPMC105" /LENGTH=107 /DNA_ID=CAMNT_0004561615 /DNA_START=124 /DNA_END=447 /DNA_ORIENTATION=-